jgi:hypothetical protein
MHHLSVLPLGRVRAVLLCSLYSITALINWSLYLETRHVFCEVGTIFLNII